MSARKRADEFFACPNCGEPVLVGSAACPHCGSDEETGWSDDADLWSGDEEGGYGEDDFDYDEFVAREFPDSHPPPAQTRLRRLARFALILVLCAALIPISLMCGQMR